ncbi:hypothetical protein APY03_7132 [Variovorax sp. WDL1]|nr:hypothetical protein APY03_7132 [Variovorax sp. WDL1]
MRQPQRAPSILDAAVSKRHRISDTPSAEDRQTDFAAMRLATLPSALDAQQRRKAPQGRAQQDARRVRIEAEIIQGSVHFRVSGKSTPVTFEELAAACREQLPGVELERRTKWLQYTFDLWSHAGQCLYSIPIASMSQAEPAGAGPATRKARRHPSELAPHHPRG